MGLARSRCYAAPARPSDDGLVAELQAITDEFEAYGYRRVGAEPRMAASVSFAGWRSPPSSVGFGPLAPPP